jgi:arylsulfate sulfotransferase
MILKLYIPLLLVLASLVSCSEAITIEDMYSSEMDTLVSSVELNPNRIAPLSAVMHVYSSQPVSVSVTLKGKHQDDLQYSIKDIKSSHDIPILGLYADYKNEILVRAYNEEKVLTSEQTIFLQTSALTLDLPEVEIVCPPSNQSSNSLYLVEYRAGINFPFVIDGYGEIRWCLDIKEAAMEPFVSDGNQFIYSASPYKKYLYKYDWTGKADSIALPSSLKYVHHSFSFNAKSFFVPAESMKGESCVAEFDYQGELLKIWNINEIVSRYLPGKQELVYHYYDWLHINSVIPADDFKSLIISGRQNIGLMKIDYLSGDIKWIIGDTGRTWYEYPELRKLALLAENSKDYPLGQHSPVLAENGEILLLDNGFEGYGESRAGLVNGGRSFSRILRLNIDEENSRFNQVMEYGSERGSDLYSPLGGNVSIDKTSGNYTAIFGMINGTDVGVPENTTGRIVEVSPAGNLLFEAKLKASDPRQLFYRVEKLEIQNLINRN